ncbi:MAG TPA: cation:proton antiporter [Pirellulaceae bacterium]|nr:cation:proton antiporter [Pirellulaceae bacterium]
MSAGEPLPNKRPSSRWRLLAFYGLSLAVTVALFFAIRAVGEKLPTPAGDAPASAIAANPAPPAAATKPVQVLPRLLAALAAVIIVGRVLGIVLGWIGQPPVIGEVIAGILLGPSLLGWICRDWFGLPQSPLLPPDVAPYLGVIAQLGVILYMFLVGVDFNTELLKSHVHAATAISHASILAPFLLGSLLALGIFGRLAPAEVSFTSFALFMGVAMAVTAFPVLARILTDRNMSRTELGVLALSCAAVDDVTAWCLLALVAGVVQSQVSGALSVIGLSLVYIAVMLLVVRPIAGRLIRRVEHNGLGPTAIAVIFAALLVSALTTEWIGIHAVFGAFLLGVTVPHDSRIAKSLSSGLEQVVTVLLLPAFFAYTGMRTQIGLISGWENWLICGLIIVVASVGKFGGTLAAARFAGLDWRMGSALGVLMNTRGLMELIVLNIGLDLGVISPTLFAMMVIMALVTTMATAPLLALLESNASARTAGQVA